MPTWTHLLDTPQLLALAAGALGADGATMAWVAAHPVIFGIALGLTLVLLFRFLKAVATRLSQFFSGAKAPQGT